MQPIPDSRRNIGVTLGLEPHAILASKLVLDIDITDLSWLYRETVRELIRYTKLVRDGKELNAAIAFGRYVQGSQLSKIFKAYERAGDWGPDGTHVQKLTEELLRLARTYDGGAYTPLAEIEAVNQKLDFLIARLEGRERPQVATP